MALFTDAGHGSMGRVRAHRLSLLLVSRVIYATAETCLSLLPQVSRSSRRAPSTSRPTTPLDLTGAQSAARFYTATERWHIDNSLDVASRSVNG